MRSLLSLLWYWLYRLAPGEWLIAIGLGWWSLFKTGLDAYILWSLALLVLLLGWAAKAMDYVVFSPTDQGWRTLSGQRFVSVQGVAAGEFLRYSDPFLRIPVRHLRVRQPVLLHFYGDDRPPHLALLAPSTIDALNRNVMDNVSYWALWYPGSEVREGMVCMAGREQPGLEFRFAGRRMVVALDMEEDAAALERIMAENA